MDTHDKHIDPVGLLPRIFSGEASPEENRLVDEWLLADPANREEYTVFARLWNITSLHLLRIRLMLIRNGRK